ncbi:DUF1156 domain-containing protein [Aquisphaera giovannonii]|nr:DUF1156 domain-containing protein [Aquisphaera giovannonii]
MNYTKRLIEVDLPIARISAHARREKSIRHGHISTLHIWWARRPLAACRAVICAALWPDPADPLCPKAFRETARTLMKGWAADQGKLQGPESFPRFLQAKQFPKLMDDNHRLRTALLDFIADFANWDNSTVPAYLETSRALTQASHEALGGEPGTRPLVVDPFAGGGSIPLEALRVGADAFASDLNPVAVLLNKVVLEYIPKYGQKLADEVRKRGEWIKKEAEKQLTEFYPREPDGSSPIAYLWARTIRCEGGDCGVEVPLLRSLWLSKRDARAIRLQLIPNRKSKRVDFRIVARRQTYWIDQETGGSVDQDEVDGTVRRGSATCPYCGYTTPVSRVRHQLVAQHGGAGNARLYCVVVASPNGAGRNYRLPNAHDLEAFKRAAERLHSIDRTQKLGIPPTPHETIATTEPRRVSVPAYGMLRWRDLFNQRQLVALVTLCQLLQAADVKQKNQQRHNSDEELAKAATLLLAFCIDRCADKLAAQVIWHTGREFVDHVFARQAIPIVWEFAEASLLSDVGISGAIEWVCRVIEANSAAHLSAGVAQQGSATRLHLPDDSAHAVITDPPYYYSVPYSHLADFFYVWLKRTIGHEFPEYFKSEESPKAEECVQDLPHSEVASRQKDKQFYESQMKKSFDSSRSAVRPGGIGIVVFAHTDTEAWESLIAAVIESGWYVTGSWPIDTEMATRLLAKRQSSLASSVHLVCRPRESSDGLLRESDIGDWRDVLAELPGRIHDWMPRLASEGIVGADAIFACLGPALEIFSRYSRVEKSNGDAVPLREYLEHVWAAVSNEALSMIFQDADAAGLEPDARLTAMWLWTLGTSAPAAGGKAAKGEDDEEDEDDEDSGGKPVKLSGFVLEFDAARKIAQGLGVHLEKSPTVVEVKGDKARLLPVGERAKHLFGKDATGPAAGAKKAGKKATQMTMFGPLKKADGKGEVGETAEIPDFRPGSTVLDRVHQAMILFAANRGEALKRFLVEEGAGRDARFWKLAQSLSALYPTGIDEKRWVDGVLARKKGLGL